MLPRLPLQGGVFMAGRMAQARRHFEDLVESILSLKAPVAAAVLRAGLSESKLLRVLASAWDWLEQCPSLWRAGQLGNHDERLVALAIVRVSATLELGPEGASVALQLHGTKEEQALIHELECRVVSLALAPRSPSLWREEDKDGEEEEAEEEDDEADHDDDEARSEGASSESCLHWAQGRCERDRCQYRHTMDQGSDEEEEEKETRGSAKPKAKSTAFELMMKRKWRGGRLMGTS